MDEMPADSPFGVPSSGAQAKEIVEIRRPHRCRLQAGFEPFGHLRHLRKFLLVRSRQDDPISGHDPAFVKDNIFPRLNP